jgi:hypothetical protein
VRSFRAHYDGAHWRREGFPCAIRFQGYIVTLISIAFLLGPRCVCAVQRDRGGFARLAPRVAAVRAGSLETKSSQVNERATRKVGYRLILDSGPQSPSPSSLRLPRFRLSAGNRRFYRDFCVSIFCPISAEGWSWRFHLDHRLHSWVEATHCSRGRRTSLTRDALGTSPTDSEAPFGASDASLLV